MPAWMTHPDAARYTLSVEPTVTIHALINVQQLINDYHIVSIPPQKAAGGHSEQEATGIISQSSIPSPSNPGEQNKGNPRIATTAITQSLETTKRAKQPKKGKN